MLQNPSIPQKDNSLAGYFSGELELYVANNNNCLYITFCSTAFFKELKYQIKRGDIHIPDRKKCIIGAHIAQVDFGDYQDNFNRSLNVVYPQYFPEWTDGIAHLIAKEHKKLRGIEASDM